MSLTSMQSNITTTLGYQDLTYCLITTNGEKKKEVSVQRDLLLIVTFKNTLSTLPRTTEPLQQGGFFSQKSNFVH